MKEHFINARNSEFFFQNAECRKIKNAKCRKIQPKYKNQYAEKYAKKKFCMQNQCKKIENRNSVKCTKLELCRMQNVETT